MLNFWGYYASVRRRFLYAFKRKYIEESIASRKGGCDCGGICCYRYAPFCKHLDNGKCTVYKKQPLFCKLFPIDEKDLKLTGLQKECTYYWDDEK